MSDIYLVKVGVPTFLVPLGVRVSFDPVGWTRVNISVIRMARINLLPSKESFFHKKSDGVSFFYSTHLFSVVLDEKIYFTFFFSMLLYFTVNINDACREQIMHHLNPYEKAFHLTLIDLL